MSVVNSVYGVGIVGFMCEFPVLLLHGIVYLLTVSLYIELSCTTCDFHGFWLFLIFQVLREMKLLEIG
jgi:hypothetical protein